MKIFRRVLLVIFVAVCALSFTACSSETSNIIEKASKTYEVANAENNEEVLEEPVEEPTEEPVEEPTEEPEEEPTVDPVDALVAEILAENNIKEDETEKVKAIVTEVYALEFEDAKTKLVSLALYYNASLTLDDVKDLSDAVLNALCDKTKVVTISYKDYLNALESLNEEYADLDELEDKVYELAAKLLEDITDEEFDAACAELKAAKATLKARTAEYEQALEELNNLYASVIKSHKDDKSNHGGSHGGNHNGYYGGHGYYYYDFEDQWEDYEDEWEDYVEEWEDYFNSDEWEDFFNDFFNGLFGDYEEEPEEEQKGDSIIASKRF